MSDPVNHPSHYTEGDIECIDAIRAAIGDVAFFGFCKGNAIKYVWRCGRKGNASEDLDKARWYIEKAMDLIEEANAPEGEVLFEVRV